MTRKLDQSQNVLQMRLVDKNELGITSKRVILHVKVTVHLNLNDHHFENFSD